MMNVPTRKGAVEIFVAAGATPDAAEILADFGRAERHAARTAAALAAATEWLAATCYSGDMLHVAALFLCHAEAFGLYGGAWNDPGSGTRRHTAFENCGKGRRQGSDGPAWTAAIKAAAGHCWVTFDADGLDIVENPTCEESRGVHLSDAEVIRILGPDGAAGYITGCLVRQLPTSTSVEVSVAIANMLARVRQTCAEKAHDGMVTLADAEACGYCSSGVRVWLKDHGFQGDAESVPVAELELYEGQDERIAKLLARARARARAAAL